MTVTLFVIVPPAGLLHVIVYVLDDVRLPVAIVPEFVRVPVHAPAPPDAEQVPDVMLAEDHVMLVPVP